MHQAKLQVQLKAAKATAQKQQREVQKRDSLERALAACRYAGSGFKLHPNNCNCRPIPSHSSQRDWMDRISG